MSKTPAKEQVMRVMADRTEAVSVHQIACDVQANLSTIYGALRDLTAEGKLVRVRTGLYANPGTVEAEEGVAPPRPPTAGPAWMSVPVARWYPNGDPDEHDEDEPQAASPSPVSPPVADPGVFGWSVRDTGVLDLRIGGRAVALLPEQWKPLAAFLARHL